MKSLAAGWSSAAPRWYISNTASRWHREPRSKWKKGNYDPWREWSCNTGKSHEYSLFSSWRIRLWQIKQMPKYSFLKVSMNILSKIRPCWKTVMFGKLFSREKTRWLIDCNAVCVWCVCVWPLSLPFHKFLTFLSYFQIINFSLSSYSVSFKGFLFNC